MKFCMYNGKPYKIGSMFIERMLSILGYNKDNTPHIVLETHVYSKEVEKYYLDRGFDVKIEKETTTFILIDLVNFEETKLVFTDKDEIKERISYDFPLEAVKIISDYRRYVDNNNSKSELLKILKELKDRF